MSEEIESKRERSRNCPTIPLAAAIELAKKLYGKAGKAKIKAEVAVNALGYAGLNGASLSTLGALSQYGLIEREKGSIVAISQQAIRLMHPLNKEQESHALEELALNPKVFNELYAEGFNNGTEDLIANHLIQNGFMPDKATKAAAVFKANIELANLKGDSINKSGDDKKSEIKEFSLEQAPQELKDFHAEVTAANEKNKGKNVLAQYSIPIGSCEATITFTGEKLSPEDFTALGEYVTLFKTQFERKQKSESSSPTLQKPAFPDPPFTALWRGNEVVIVGQPVFEKGEWIYQDGRGTLIPSKELFYNFGK